MDTPAFTTRQEVMDALDRNQLTWPQTLDDADIRTLGEQCLEMLNDRSRLIAMFNDIFEDPEATESLKIACAKLSALTPKLYLTISNGDAPAAVNEDIKIADDTHMWLNALRRQDPLEVGKVIVDWKREYPDGLLRCSINKS